MPHLDVIAYPLMLLSTLVHELGHGMGALLGGGSFGGMTIHPDGSGSAGAGGPTPFREAFTCAAGLVGPAVVAAIFLVVGLRPKLARAALAATGVYFAIAIVLWVYGTFAIAVVAIVAVICLAVAVLTSAETSRLVVLFLATQLALSAYSRSDYLFEDYVGGQMSGGHTVRSDVKIMEEALGGPYWFWGIACAAFSIAVIAFGAWLYLRTPKRDRRRAPA